MNESSGKTWLEVALNGPWTRSRQPGIPIAVKDIVEQGIACVKAGAAIVHLHAYEEATGRQTEDPEVYARLIEGIRSKVDAIVYPTVPGAGLGTGPGARSPRERFAHIEELARRGLLEFAVVDPGSTNIAHYDELREDKPGFVYLNAEEDIRYGLKLAMRHRFHPACAIYEPGFLRLGAALRWRESTPNPVYRFMFSRGFTFGFPPEDYGLTAYLKLLDQVAPGAQWMVGGLDVDITPMIPRTVMEGGHVRVGLEDAPFGSDRSNVQWVEEAARIITNCGSELASAAEVRIAISPEEHEPA
ncbi:MAG TPA: 3-keto-5-aminohexanoate cleavage protein [Burkholderiales bacterium]|jgi:3-keto-5-aminohexanoate cleavage enzyme|nr:3-keto-5-aminohexanoate cleavage protein [Burkholderiales bacterium]